MNEAFTAARAARLHRGRRPEETWRSIKGASDRTVARLMALMPEIGLVSTKAISRLTGLALLTEDSGETKGKRPVREGRKPILANLFIVADIARRFDPNFTAFQTRLVAAGKPKKVIRIVGP